MMFSWMSLMWSLATWMTSSIDDLYIFHIFDTFGLHALYGSAYSVYFPSCICIHIFYNLTWFLKSPFPTLYFFYVTAWLFSCLFWSFINLFSSPDILSKDVSWFTLLFFFSLRFNVSFKFTHLKSHLFDHNFHWFHLI